MTTLGIKLKREPNPDDVCHHSGETQSECAYKCGSICGYRKTNPKPTTCNCAFVGCPSVAEIYSVRAPAVRDDWPEWRLDGFQMASDRQPIEIPNATLIWDHRRKADNGRATR